MIDPQKDSGPLIPQRAGRGLVAKLAYQAGFYGPIPRVEVDSSAWACQGAHAESA